MAGAGYWRCLILGERVRFCKLTDFNLFFLSVAEMSRNEPIIFLSMINFITAHVTG